LFLVLPYSFNLAKRPETYLNILFGECPFCATEDNEKGPLILIPVASFLLVLLLRKTVVQVEGSAIVLMPLHCRLGSLGGSNVIESAESKSSLAGQVEEALHFAKFAHSCFNLSRIGVELA
jgi:hypothetical protein